MIKVTCNYGEVNVHKVSGSSVQVMSELCCIVAAVCQGWSSDEDDSERVRTAMIEAVARTLLAKKDEVSTWQED